MQEYQFPREFMEVERFLQKLLITLTYVAYVLFRIVIMRRSHNGGLNRVLVLGSLLLGAFLA